MTALTKRNHASVLFKVSRTTKQLTYSGTLSASVCVPTGIELLWSKKDYFFFFSGGLMDIGK